MTRRIALALAVVALVAGACGDDDGGSTGGFGGGDEPPDVEDVLGDLEDLDLSDPDAVEDMLDDLEDSAEDFIDEFSEGGSGTVEVNGETIDFDAEVCFAGQGDFTAEGPGTASDGTPVWVSISYSEDTREEMEAVLDEDFVDQMFGDADVLINQDVTVDFGRDELFGSAPDDQPSFSATGSSTFGGGDLEITVDGDSATGSGQATDFNYVAGDFDDTFPISFEARCG